MATLIEQEKRVSGIFNAGLLILLITGCVTYFFTQHGAFQESLTIIHAAFGLALTLPLPVYLIIHYRRTIGYRRPITMLLGILSNIFLLITFISGLYLAIWGHQERLGWVLDLHLISLSLFVILIVLHILHHKLSFPERRKESQAGFYESLSDLPNRILVFAGVSLVVLISLMIANHILHEPNNEQPYVTEYELPYGPHPFRPSQTETSNGTFIEARLLNDSQQCVHCHEDIAKQWLSSAHRQAASDKSYETNVTLLAKKKGIAATRYCEGCHAPVALLSGALSEGGYHGGIEKTDANREGVNCLACHSIKKTLNTKGVASFEYGLPSPYLFSDSDNAFLETLNRLSIRLNPVQHKRDMITNEMSHSSYCANCHAQFMDESMNQWGWVQMQDEYQAWLASNFSGQHEPEFSQSEVKHCQDCHMPKVASLDPSADQQGLVSDHRFLASNTMLPLLDNDKEQLDKTIEFLKSNKLTVSIDKPYRSDATRNDMALDETLRKQAIQPYYFYKGEKAKIQIVVANTGIGHDFPGGTIDINEAWLAIIVRDATGKVIFSSGDIKEDEALPSDVYQYRAIPVDRQGNHVWKHDLFNMIGDVSKNVIPSGESDVVTVDFDIPHWATGPISINSVLRYRKLNLPYAKWALNNEYQPLPIVDMAKDYLTIPIREEFEVY